MSVKLNLNWKITAILCTLILSGTVLFIYEDSQQRKAETLEHAQQVDQEAKRLNAVASQAMARQAEVDKSKKEMSYEEVVGIATPTAGQKPWEDFRQPSNPNLILPTPDPILAEMRRANQIAADKLFFEELNTPDSLDRYMDRKQQSDLIWLQSLQADDLHRIRQIYEQQDFRQQYGGQ